MYEHVTPAVLATEAVLTLSGFEGVVVWVEGPTDVRIYEGILDPRYFRVVHGINKDMAIRALEALDGFDNISDEKKGRVIALVDADFDRPIGLGRHPRAFVTDFHDVDVMIMWSDAFARWLREYALADKLNAMGGIDGVRAKLRKL